MRFRRFLAVSGGAGGSYTFFWVIWHLEGCRRPEISTKKSWLKKIVRQEKAPSAAPLFAGLFPRFWAIHNFLRKSKDFLKESQKSFYSIVNQSQHTLHHRQPITTHITSSSVNHIFLLMPAADQIFCR